MPVHLFTPSSFHIARSYPPPTPVNLPTSPLNLTPRLSFSYLSLPIPHALIPLMLSSIIATKYTASLLVYTVHHPLVSACGIHKHQYPNTTLLQTTVSSTRVSSSVPGCLSSHFYSFDQSGRHMNRSPTLLSVAPTMPQPLHSLDTSTQRDIAWSWTRLGHFLLDRSDEERSLRWNQLWGGIVRTYLGMTDRPARTLADRTDGRRHKPPPPNVGFKLFWIEPPGNNDTVYKKLSLAIATTGGYLLVDLPAQTFLTD